MKLPSHVDTNSGYKNLFDRNQFSSDPEKYGSRLTTVPVANRHDGSTYIPIGDHETPISGWLWALVSESLTEANLTVIEFIPKQAATLLPVNIALSKRSFPPIEGFVFENRISRTGLFAGRPVNSIHKGGHTKYVGLRLSANLHRSLVNVVQRTKRKQTEISYTP